MQPPGCNIGYWHPTIAMHLHDYEGRMIIGGKEVWLRPGDVTFSPARQETVYDLPKAGRHLCIHFNPALSAKEKSIRLPNHFRPGSRTASVRERMWRVIDHFRRGGEKTDSPSGVAAAATLLELLIWLHVQSHSRARAVRGGVAEDSLAGLLKAIDSSLQQPITVPELAAQSGWSADYISRLFRKRYAMTIPRFLLLRRMELARHLLLSSSMPVQKIGDRVGIPDPQYFNKQFRKTVGLSPSGYRMSQRKHGPGGKRFPRI